MSIPVICDRCRATGSTGEGDFTHLGDLLGFTPVVRRARVDGWTHDRQRAFIAALSATGSKRRAAIAIGMQPYGVDQLLKAHDSASFKAAYDRALAIAAQAGSMKIAQGVADAAARNAQLTPPSRLRGEPLPGQVLNENGEWDDPHAIARRISDARDSISAKLLRARRLYLMEIAGSPGKRAAFEILTGFPIDWERARHCEAQDDEPWRKPKMREPDMLLTAENGWLGGACHGPDKKEELQLAINRHRADQGLPAIDWGPSAADYMEGESTGCSDADAEHPASVPPEDAPSPPAPDDPETPPQSRTFTLNSEEFYDAVTDSTDRPWIANGALPREPRHRDQPVIVEPREQGKRK
ncbi:hypothetical protein [Sphingomonas sp.]|uniref:hypothetical protein n=1 Tax=Sphingomonas sp. TaxID=28214 RepID=UPI0025E34E86|nr:hypothetical protein [Sphingomonas sp.]MBV9528339.1 hypothetical protein [Sphingomonas sp.]